MYSECYIVSGHKSILKKKMKLSINDALKLYLLFCSIFPSETPTRKNALSNIAEQ